MKLNTDRVIGPFEIWRAGKGDPALSADAERFVVVEAKVFSKLSASAKGFDFSSTDDRCI